MDLGNCLTDLPVVLLYDLDPSWSQQDQEGIFPMRTTTSDGKLWGRKSK
jgi:hypothetical protein